MKVFCNIDLDERKFEGRTQLANVVSKNLKDERYDFVKDPAEADLIHFHSSGVFDSYPAWRLGKKHRKPVIYSLYSNITTSLLMHPVNFAIQKIFLQKTATKFLQSYSAALPLFLRGFFLKKLNTIIVPSTYLQRKLYKNTVVIPFGVDVDTFKPLPRKKEGNKVRVAYFGHASVFKGLNDYVNASKFFGPDCEAHIFMTQRFAKVDNYIQRRNPHLIIHGFTEDIVEAYNEMDIIVLPYRMEIGTVANPLVLLEAMACGKAIITTDFAFVREIVGDAAIVVKKYSPKAIMKAVAMVKKNKQLREELGKKARERVEQRYTLQKMLESYHQLYREYEEH